MGIDLSFSNIKSSFAQSKTSSTIIFYLLFFILIYPHHSELAEESRRTAAELYGITKNHAAVALISPLRSFLATVEMMRVTGVLAMVEMMWV